MVPFALTVDHVQGDAYAAPSRCHVTLPLDASGIPADLVDTKVRSVACADFLSRVFVDQVQRAGIDRVMEGGGGWSGAKGGDLRMEPCSQHILERTSVIIRTGRNELEARFTVSLPARGRSICGTYAAHVLGEALPGVVGASLLHASLSAAALRRHVDLADDQECLRASLKEAGLAAFVRDGAVLPRASGNSDKPMSGKEAVAFASPSSLRRTVRLPHVGDVTGMAIPRGVTLICGGGFHGKSTLLQALEKGVYSHVEGDGRELVATSPSAVKIRAEDGRAVSSVDISAFINNLPRGKGTTDFTTPDASGSTSQAANIVEALEAGCDLLLIDEDSSATNFMIRDARMSQLIAPDKEPITPFIARARQLWEEHGVSTIVVVGGAGDYFAVADLVIAIDEYVPADVTDRALAIVEAAGGRDAVVCAASTPMLAPLSRSPAGGVELVGKVHIRDIHRVTQFDELALDLTGVEQLVELGQTRAIVEALATIQKRVSGGSSAVTPSLATLLDELESAMDKDGVDVLKHGWFHNGLCRPRRFELAAALGRVRTAKFTQGARVVLSHPTEASGEAAVASASASSSSAASSCERAVWL